MIPVAFDLRDPVRSGIARVARSMARALAEMSDGRFSITLAGPVPALEALGARTWGNGTARLVNWDAPRYSPRAELGWRRVMREAGDSVWFFPHWDIPWTVTPRRFVVSLNDLNHVVAPESLSMARRTLARLWMRRAVVGAKRIAVISQHTQNDLLRTWPDVAGKSALVPCGIDPLFLAPAAPLPSEVARRIGDGRFMLSVGILKKHKNLERAVAVLSGIPTLNWVVVGEEFPDWQSVLACARGAGVMNRIIQLPPQPDETLHALYAGAACLFFPSRREGFGLPIIEAFAVGTPVVASTAGASAETSGGLATLCDPDDSDAFVSAVRDAIANGEHGAENRRQRARQFTWRQSAERLAQLLTAAAA